MAMHSILASRIFFNLRETGRREQKDTPPITLTEFHATPQTSSALSGSFKLGNSSTSSGIDPTQTVDTTRVIDITGEPVPVIQG